MPKVISSAWSACPGRPGGAFASTIIGHDYLETLIENKPARAFLDGVTAGVVGLIGATAWGLLNETITHLPAWILFSLALIALFRSKSKWTVGIVVLAAGLFELFALYEEMLLFKKIALSRVRGAP